MGARRPDPPRAQPARHLALLRARRTRTSRSRSLGASPTRRCCTSCCCSASVERRRAQGRPGTSRRTSARTHRRRPGAPINHVFVPEDVERAPCSRRWTPARRARGRRVPRAARTTVPARPRPATRDARPPPHAPPTSSAATEDRPVPAHRVRGARAARPPGAARSPPRPRTTCRSRSANLGDTWRPARPRAAAGDRPSATAGAPLDGDRSSSVPTLRTPFTETRRAGRDHAPDRRRDQASSPQAGELELVVDVVHEWFALARLRDATQRVTVTPALRRDGSSPSCASGAAPLRRTPCCRNCSSSRPRAASSTSAAASGELAARRARPRRRPRSSASTAPGSAPGEARGAPLTRSARPTSPQPLELDAPLRPRDLAWTRSPSTCPSGAAAGFVASLAAAAPVVAFSAAIPGPGRLRAPQRAVARLSGRSSSARHGFEPVDALAAPLLWDDPRRRVVVRAERRRSTRARRAPPPSRSSPPTYPQRGSPASSPARCGRGHDLARARTLAARVAALDTTLFASHRVADHRAGPCDRCSRSTRRSPSAARSATSRSAPTSAARCRRSFADARCTEIVSIDTRPPPSRTTAAASATTTTTAPSACCDLLDEVPGADLSKLRTFEIGTDSSPSRSCPARPLCA